MQYKSYFTNNSNYYLTLTITETLQEDYLNTNKSDVNYTLTATKTAGSGYYNSNANNLVQVSINGTYVVNQNITFDFRGSTPKTIQLANGVVTGIEHNSDGSKIIPVSAYFDMSRVGVGNASISSEFALTTIPRASTVTATRAYIGEISQITVYKKNNNFIHSIQYSFGNLSGYINSSGNLSSTEVKMENTSIGFEIPQSFANQMPTSNEKDCTLTVRTYNGDTQIGLGQTTTFKVVINPTDSSPTITGSVYDTNSTTYALTGSRTTVIMGYSKPRVSYVATAKDGATIDNVQINNVVVTSSPYTFTVNEPFIVIMATDSRGNMTDYSPYYYMHLYYEPVISITECKRISPTSSSINVTFSGGFYNRNFGSVNNKSNLKISWKYRKVGETSWTDGATLVEGTHYNVSGNNIYSGTSSSGSSRITISKSGALSYNNSWELGIFVEDSLASTLFVQNVPRGIPVINWNSDTFNVNGKIKKNNKDIIETTFQQVNLGGTYNLGDVSDVKFIIVYFVITSTGYKNSAIIPYGDNAWYDVNAYEGVERAIYFQVNWNVPNIVVSEYSTSGNYVTGWTLVR